MKQVVQSGDSRGGYAAFRGWNGELGDVHASCVYVLASWGQSGCLGACYEFMRC